MKKIAIIGGSYLQLPAVKKAQELGYEVHCFSWKDGAVCEQVADYFYPISIVEKEAILKKCQEIRIDGICTIASDTAVLTVNYVANHMNLISNPDEYSEVCTNKFLMRQCFTSSNIPSPLYKKISSNSDLDNFDSYRYPLVVKPTDRSGSRGVEKVYNFDDLKIAVDRARKESFKNEAIVEEFVTGREISVESISYNGKHYILQITDKVTTEEPYFVELEHHQPSNLPQLVKDEVKEIVIRALNSLHIKYGASHSEMKITEDGKIKVIEIGARMGGDFIGSDLVKLSTGYDFLEGVINVSMGTFTEPKITENNFSGVYFLSEETKHLLPLIKGWKSDSEIIKAEITCPELHNIQCSSDRSGYFIYKSNKKRYEVKK